MATPVQMPKQGNSVEECLITEWNVKEGDSVAAGAVLCTIETDKATFEVEAPEAGTVLKLFYPAGELVPVLVNIAVIGAAGEDASSFAPDGAAAPAASAPVAAPEAAPVASAPEAAASAAPAPVAMGGDAGAPVSPRAKAEAAKLGVNPAAVAGSGPNGRVLSEDILAAAASGARMTPTAMAAAASTGMVAGAGTGIGGLVRAGDLVAAGSAPCGSCAPCSPCEGASAPTVMAEEVPYRGIRKLIGDRMAASLANHAQLTLNASADASAMLAYRNTVKESGEKLGLPNITIGDMIAIVVAKTLPRFPELNGLFDKAMPVFTKRRDVQLGIAIDTERGLMVPVVPNAHMLTLSQLSAEIADLAKQCRAGKIDPERLAGGTFTITNLGAMGVESFTPVLNSPQVAILGVCAVTQRPQPDGKGGVKFVPTMGLSLTIDHQVVDGGPAARFLQAIATGIANFNLILAS